MKMKIQEQLDKNKQHVGELGLETARMKDFPESPLSESDEKALTQIIAALDKCLSTLMRLDSAE